MSEKVSCAQRIREGLALRDMTQADLCRITGIGKSAMSQYVNGGLVPRQDRTLFIAKALNVSEPWLMGFDVPMERTSEDTKTAPNSEDGLAAEAIRLFRSLPEDKRRQALEFLRFLAASSAQQ